jgi:hypothetical protein
MRRTIAALPPPLNPLEAAPMLRPVTVGSAQRGRSSFAEIAAWQHQSWPLLLGTTCMYLWFPSPSEILNQPAMKITRLQVENFRAVRHATLAELGETVLIAGPNGCGKSCLFDAIRLLKSTYGGYQPNEWQQWFGEFQINLRDEIQLLKLFHDRSQPVRVAARLALSDREKNYLREHALELCTALLWQQVSPESTRYASRAPSLTSELRQHRDTVDARALATSHEILDQIEAPHLNIEVCIHPNLETEPLDCTTAEVVVSTYDPEHIGVIDFHAAHRNYQRERLGGINLDIQSSESQLRQHALYNAAQKYQNIKSHMAAHYIRDLLMREARVEPVEAGTSLIDTLHDLFRTFFPDKTFVGPRPRPDGSLDFPVQLTSGAVHDIDDLSSGEKEILYGYLRIRNTAPQSSILLIDEPELHLNPRLIRGLPNFYHRHLGKALDNQIWLVTHSDAFLRQAVGQREFSIFHMKGPGEVDADEDQITGIAASDELRAAIIDLVGDLPSWHPEGKHVIFEGEEDVEFDVRMTCKLFPHFERLVNPIAGKSKAHVQRLHELLDDGALSRRIPGRFYAILDCDSGTESEKVSARAFKWDVYHIENYLLEPTYILKVLRDLTTWESGEEEVLETLRECASVTLSGLVGHQLEQNANRSLVRQIKTATSRGEGKIARELHAAVTASMQRIDELSERDLSLEALEREEKVIRNRLSQNLKSDEWRKTFKGREVLRQFVHQYVSKRVRRIGYEEFRDLVIGRMRDAGFEPPGMKKVIDAILKD